MEERARRFSGQVTGIVKDLACEVRPDLHPNSLWSKTFLHGYAGRALLESLGCATLAFKTQYEALERAKEQEQRPLTLLQAAE